MRPPLKGKLMRAIALTMLTLPRLELPKVDFSGAMKLAKFASDSLGYEKALHEIRDLRLLQILERCNLMPFAPAAVVAYKTAQQKKARKGHWTPARWDIKWRLANLTRYEGIVPFSVLDSAKLVLEETGKGDAPRLAFSVDYLADSPMEREDPPVAYDPFLCVNVDGGPRHRIAVWDEPTFKF